MLFLTPNRFKALKANGALKEVKLGISNL